MFWSIINQGGLTAIRIEGTFLSNSKNVAFHMEDPFFLTT
jgi:hypothetical protein